MKKIDAELKTYHRKTSRKKSDGSKGEYKTTQYLITLKKDDVEAQDFKDIENVSVVVPDELIKLQKHDEDLQNQVIDLQSQLIKLQNVQIEYDKLENKYKHLQGVYNKREKELSACQNEVTRLQNRGFMELIADKIRRKPAIETKEKE